MAHSAPIIQLGETTSTNDELGNRWRERNSRPLLPFTSVVADFQTRGRGRLGRQWEAPKKSSLLLSILVPTTEEDATWMPLAGGLATALVLDGLLPAPQGLDETAETLVLDGLLPTDEGTQPGGAANAPAVAPRVDLKWPNDLLVGGKKIAGILSERLGKDPDGTVWVALGIGVNVTQGEDELPPVPSTSLRLQGAAPVSRTALAHMIIEQLKATLTSASLANDYATRCVSTRGNVHATLPDGSTITGTGTGIDTSGALLVEDEGGTTHTISAGDVTLADNLPETPGALQ
ncbi:biotin--[acetyl-CoA-carboxylase] ligase [Schaalia sp. JY-X169]|uniref:biotin--[acetyl-CoA-carboxylase] ligase n=1 Tax=Schaalia sp. JY-X169 TaxID=2758572 RepID=UPI0015F6229A|nr:biotin--[acetyl-CoA-carboxylase] ligase [Schaalia sp. JY-X169]